MVQTAEKVVIVLLQFLLKGDNMYYGQTKIQELNKIYRAQEVPETDKVHRASPTGYRN